MAVQMDLQVHLKEVDATMRSIEEAISEGTLERFFQREVAPWLSNRARQRFASEGDDATGAWAPLSEATLKIKRAMGYAGRGINQRTGQLEQWATNGGFDASSTPDGGNFKYPRTKPRGKLRKKVSGAQNGTDSAPARPVIGFSEYDAEVILQMFARHLGSITQ